MPPSYTFTNFDNKWNLCNQSQYVLRRPLAGNKLLYPGAGGLVWQTLLLAIPLGVIPFLPFFKRSERNGPISLAQMSCFKGVDRDAYPKHEDHWCPTDWNLPCPTYRGRRGTNISHW